MTPATHTPHQLWDATCHRVRNQVGREMYLTYIARLSPSSWSQGELLLETDDEIAAEVVKKNYLPVLELAVSSLVGHPSSVRVRSALASVGPLIEDESELSNQLSLFGDPRPSRTAAPRPRRPSAARPEPTSGPLAVRAREAHLSTERTLDRYLRGETNQLAVGAVEMLLRTRGSFAYNPLVLVGEVGVGKTHLMNALGLELLKAQPDLRVKLVTAEDFTNGLLEALATNRRTEFRRAWREDVDVLLIDDVQFLGGKRATLEEFYHTFNAVSHNRLVVLTCDQSPFTLEGFDDRLKSRLCNGMIADIKPPDVPMREAFIRGIAEQRGVHVPESVVRYLAANVDGAFRALSGVLSNLLARAPHNGGRIDQALVQRVIETLHVPTHTQGLDPHTLLQAVAEVYGVRSEELLGRGRTSRVSVPRQVAMLLLREHAELSFPAIGQLFGRDHSTVMSNCTTARRRLESGDETLHAKIQHVRRRLNLG